MKINVSRTAVGQALGYLILIGSMLLFSYASTAWVWWETDPGLWSFAARVTALAVVVILLGLRWLGNALRIREDDDDDE